MIGEEHWWRNATARVRSRTHLYAWLRSGRRFLSPFFSFSSKYSSSDPPAMYSERMRSGSCTVHAPRNSTRLGWRRWEIVEISLIMSACAVSDGCAARTFAAHSNPRHLARKTAPPAPSPICLDSTSCSRGSSHSSARPRNRNDMSVNFSTIREYDPSEWMESLDVDLRMPLMSLKKAPPATEPPSISFISGTGADGLDASITASEREWYDASRAGIPPQTIFE
mmetsp:Transcript_12691/g.30801  ORF Transcript_12691/g.30801 Transcript_12691/m.30801 type:complete len:224 (-) Transcript_12691:249-920(-)